MNYIKNNITENYMFQSSLKKSICFSGVGIHNGKAVSMEIEPSDINTGIVFERTDLLENNIIKASIENVTESQFCTKIKNNHGVSVSTIEHLMAAFNGLNIDNARIKINSSELPALDGSSYEYVKRITRAGICTQNQPRNFLKILKKVEVRDGNRFISITPYEEFKINVSIHYPNTVIGNSKFIYHHSKDNFVEQLSKARTYAFSEDVDKMRTSGFAMGGNFNNAIVVNKFNILNPEGLRFEKEFVKHKTLDCVGDFYLVGSPLIGSIECFAPGHKLNQRLIEKILQDNNNYKIEHKNVDHLFSLLDDNKISPNIINVA